MAKRKRRLKRKFRRLLKLLLFIIVILFVVLIIKKLKGKKYITSIEYNDNLIVNLIDNDDLYCMLSNEKPNIESNKWIKSDSNKCILNYNNENNIYIKNDNEILYSSNKDLFFELKEDNLFYLASNTDKLDIFKYRIGNIDKLSFNIDNKEVISFNDGFVKPLKNGEANITINSDEVNKTIKVIVTSLITKRPSNYDFNKEKLKCEKYTKEENDLLDTILDYKVNSVGYKTRASVVEAARFLTLDFPYRINYFYENGRLHTNKVDGEGRYYHKGLYLDESRFDSISGSTTLNNIGTWGCSIYSVPIKDYDNNGLDCSGFVSWVLVNGGFDPGDLGAGFTDTKDLTNLGTVKKINDSNSIDGTIKVGDLLHNERNDGHIAIIVGIDNDYYYVAQAVWFDEVGVIISKFKKEELKSEFPHVVLMDKYYKNDGNLTNMW